MMIHKEHPLASVRDSFNAVFVHGDAADDAMFYGRGAGEFPTASACLLYTSMGRPKSDVIKDKIVTIRMSAEEHQKLRDYSEKHQQTITETLKEGVDLLYKTRD